jgi:hypothetical protein
MPDLGEQAQPTQWQYRIERLESVEEFDAVGAAGWELVAVDNGAHLAWFKRDVKVAQKPDGEKP